MCIINFSHSGFVSYVVYLPDIKSDALKPIGVRKMDKHADEISQSLYKLEIDLKRKSKILCVTMFNAWLHCIQFKLEFKLEFKLMKLFLLKGGVTNNSLIITNVLGRNQPKATEDLQHIRKAQSKKRDNYVRVAKLHAYAITFFDQFALYRRIAL